MGQQVSDAIHLHRSYDVCIMDLFPARGHSLQYLKQPLSDSGVILCYAVLASEEFNFCAEGCDGCLLRKGLWPRQRSQELSDDLSANPNICANPAMGLNSLLCLGT